MISQLHYISQYPHLENIQAACDAGCNWIQLRVKDQPVAEIQELATTVKQLCDRYQATLIINDHPAIAVQVMAAGVHVGQEDMNAAAARLVVGDNKIVGGTANTFEQIAQHIQNNASYVGVGPFRFTTTKQKLSPILGLEGYRQILTTLKQNELNIPLIAIGGIKLEDIPALIEAGVHGIAVSGLISNSNNKALIVKEIYNLLKGNN
ncbi:thiamine phosphate synthase [Chitinophaga silvatica]|uniref:Thiamine-phosphate synthase n=1 Tax=Chitinophaga silvatica TaxID=2282649 RepID=A0A3E1YBY1_9BACT|nr:thiamine phosphate synthase [Chitinophaga silvatica]RFS23509.1 thiamine phosphate synthase [Chitinophaga silvatica]